MATITLILLAFFTLMLGFGVFVSFQCKNGDKRQQKVNSIPLYVATLAVLAALSFWLAGGYTLAGICPPQLSATATDVVFVALQVLLPAAGAALALAYALKWQFRLQHVLLFFVNTGVLLVGVLGWAAGQ